jgi:hypothetical protein
MITETQSYPLQGESLITLAEAAADFGGRSVSLSTVKKYVYRGVDGLKLESISIDGRLTSKEAICRFIARRQNRGHLPVKPRGEQWSQARVEETLRRHGIKK